MLVIKWVPVDKYEHFFPFPKKKSHKRVTKGTQRNPVWFGKWLNWQTHLSVGGVTTDPSSVTQSSKHTDQSHFSTWWTVTEAVSFHQKTWEKPSEQECDRRKKRIKIYSFSIPGGPNEWLSSFVLWKTDHLSQPCFDSWILWNIILGNRENTF